MKQNAKWKICLTLLTMLLLTALAGASWDGGPSRPAVVVYEETAAPEEMTALLEEMEDVTVRWEYAAFFSGAAVEADAGTLRALEELDGVARVALAETYTCGVTTSKEDAVESHEGLALMGADGLWERGYTGDGLVIAVIDSGLNVNHEVFADASLTKSPALSRTDVEDFARKGGTRGRYVSSRIPFVYDYYSNDTDVSTTNQHGTHVTALAAGYALDEDGGTAFRGAAPGAQILGMKIFPDGSGSGTDDTIILRALEDAWNLGADVINISVGIRGGFSTMDDMNGLYCRAFRQISDSGAAIFCAAGNSRAAVTYKDWSQPLPTGGYPDYSSVFSPASLYGAVGVAAATQKNGRTAMADYSSWGPASGLHFCPALTVFGGPVMAASATVNDGYREEEGTSMASPVASGVYASLMQSLRERGLTGKQQASAIALGLLESTASLLTDGGSGLPLSPRRQGAGYVDLTAAAESELVVMNPLIELGDSGDGRFTLTMTLRNLSQKSITASLDVQALTDDYKQEGGASYSRMAPRDITGGVSITGDRSVTVPAGGEAKATLTLAVDGALREELAPVYPNGFYVEGFVTAQGGNHPVHAAFLGFCGNWEAAPVLEPSDFRDVQDAEYRLSGGTANTWRNPDLVKKKDYLKELNADMGANLVFLAGSKDAKPEDGVLLGANSRVYAPHSDVRFAVPARNGEAAANSVLCVNLYAQRNAAGLVMLVSNPETKEIYFAGEERLVDKSQRLSNSSGIVPSAGFSWDVTDAQKSPLPAGTTVRVDVYAWLDTNEDVEAAYTAAVRAKSPGCYAFLLDGKYDQYREMSFPVVVDGESPAAAASLSGPVLTLTLTDDRCVSYALAKDAAGNLLAERAYTPAKAGESCILTVDFTGKDMPDTVYIQAEDYASHQASYELDLKSLAAGKAAAPRRSAASALTDVPANAWYREAVNYVLDKGIMEAENSAFRPDHPAARAEIVTALHRASGSPASKYSGGDLPFTDISSRSRYVDALCWAYEHKIVSGRGDGTFGGSYGVTRQELAVMLYRCASLDGAPGASGGLAAFPDASSVASWASEAMSWAVGRGLIRGNEAGNLSPAAGVTRAETAQIIMRFLEGE